MSFLTLFDEEPPHDPPDRVYARVDREEPVGGDAQAVLLLDSVDAGWFDEIQGSLESLSDPEISGDVDEHVSVVEIPPEVASGIPEDRRAEGEWMELPFAEGGERVFHFLNLFAAPLERSVAGWYRPPPETTDALAEKTDMRWLPDAHWSEVTRVLESASAKDGAIVYDVGQGSCCSLLNARFPSLYFDFGGGVLRDKNTFPEALRHFCFTQHPPIVLSHWDWDHWSSARRDARAMKQTWLVPRQDRLGAVHSAFLGQLLSEGQVLVFPDASPWLTGGGLRLERCTGPRSSRNDSGLALVVDFEPENEGGPKMLFPGDAAYHHIPSLDHSFTSMVVSHHGGRTRSKGIPAFDGHPAGRLVYSYGRDNSYGHSFSDVRASHAEQWPSARQTEDRDGSGLGHVHLPWDPNAPALRTPCGGQGCNLEPRQR